MKSGAMRMSVLQRGDDLGEACVAAHGAVVVAEEAVEEVAARIEVVVTGEYVVRARGRIEARCVLADELVLLRAVVEVLHRDRRVLDGRVAARLALAERVVTVGAGRLPPAGELRLRRDRWTVERAVERR